MIRSIEEIKNGLAEVGYYADNETAAAVAVMLCCNKPLLIEGDPGVGKTSIAAAIAKMLDKNLIRLQMYEGLTDDKILYDYDYQKQLLTLEAVKPHLEKEYADKTTSEMIEAVAKRIDFYGEDFLVKRPILRSIDGSAPVLLIDEIDKAPEEIEYMLYEFLEDYSITIPQFGEVRCPEDKRPIVILTSNHYRELSDALKRRCNYLYIKRKSKEDIKQILTASVKADPELAEAVAVFAVRMSEHNDIHKLPSLSELIEWTKFMKATGIFDISMSLSMLVKDHRDIEVFRRNLEEVSIIESGDSKEDA